jgi:murein DD-endopeptidase MepM/ murein hydrolase activator NlpD
MTFEFKPLSNTILSKKTENFLVKYKEKPNFVLLSNNPKPFEVNFHEFFNKKITKFEGSKDQQKIFKQNFFILVWYIIQYAIQYSIYLIYISFLKLVSLCISIPNFFLFVVKRLLNILHMLAIPDTRDLWYLNRKFDIKYFNNSIRIASKSGFLFFKNFYLGVIILVCLAVLQSRNLTISADQNQVSFFSRFVSNNSPKNNEIKENSINSLNLFTLNASAAPIQKIIQYQVKNGDTLDKIGFMFGVSKDTLILNNNLSNDSLNSDQNLYIPWVDGYIYKNQTDSSPEEIGILFDLTKEDILSENSAQFNPETGKYSKDTLILIPSNDVNSLIGKLNEIKIRQENERKAKEEEQKRQEILAKQAVSAKSISNSSSYQSGSKNQNTSFIWPTTGSISRCYSYYHNACDIANFSSPPIVSVAAGTVIATYYFEVFGYGLAVVVDHGNGIQTLYAHMSSISVKKGQQVNQGDQLGIMGQTGMATGIHLHFEVIVNGVKSDPIRYLP